MIAFAIVAAWMLPRLPVPAALLLAAGVWLTLALVLYVLIWRRPRRRKRPATSARTTSA